MSSKHPRPYPSISPYLLYEDVERAVDWLSGAFGFEEREHERMRNEQGVVVHAAMDFADGVVMMGRPGDAYRNPKSLGATTQYLYVYVDDVASHYERARAAGGLIIGKLEDTAYGDRRYGVEDPEGHQWYFAQALSAESD